MSRRRSALDRVMDKVTIDANGCWIFTGCRNIGGYGLIMVYRADGVKTHSVAHRVTYAHYVGSIPDGLQLDHLCRKPACCNPDHLEAVTPSENIRRYRRLSTHCPSGHAYTREPGEAVKRCVVCLKASWRRSSARHRAREKAALLAGAQS